MTHWKDELFALLLKDAFFKQPVILSSGKKSDYYIDARRVTLSAKGAALCGRWLFETVSPDSYDAYGGPTLGADPLVGALGVLLAQNGLDKKGFIVRKQPKSHGRGRMIEGPDLCEKDRVLLFDDVATTGKAMVSAIEALSQQGVRVAAAVCLIDREEGAAQTLAAHGVELVSLFKGRDFLAAQ